MRWNVAVPPDPNLISVSALALVVPGLLLHCVIGPCCPIVVGSGLLLLTFDPPICGVTVPVMLGIEATVTLGMEVIITVPRTRPERSVTSTASGFALLGG